MAILLFAVPLKAMAQSFPEPSKCPANFDLVNQEKDCCEKGSTFINQGSYCLYSTVPTTNNCNWEGARPYNKGACHITVTFGDLGFSQHCGPNTLLWGQGVFGKPAICISQGSEIPDGYSKAGSTFVACTNYVPESRTIFNPSTNQNTGQFVDDVYCVESGAKIVEESDIVDGACICKDGTVGPESATCSQTCSSKGGVLIDTLNGTGNGGGVVNPNCSGGTDCCADGDTKCVNCVSAGKIYTSIGCIDPSVDGIIVWVIRVAIGLIMAISVFRFIQAAMMFQKADPESVEEAKEILTSAVIALIFALISVPLLQFLGVNILGVFPAGPVVTQ